MILQSTANAIPNSRQIYSAAINQWPQSINRFKTWMQYFLGEQDVVDVVNCDLFPVTLKKVWHDLHMSS
jgi:hypothetical protein